MSLSLARKNAWSLAKRLMVCITLFKADKGYGVMPSAEFDGDPAPVLHEYASVHGRRGGAYEHAVPPVPNE